MKTKIAFLCAALLAFAASPVFAQSCGRGVVVRGNPVCHTPVVVHKPVVVTPVAEVITPVAVPVALPVIVPAFTYQYVPPVVQAGTPYYPGAPAPAVGQPYPVYPGGAPAGPGTPTYGQPVYGQPPVQYHGPYQQPVAQPQPTLPGGDGNAKLRELAKLLLEEMRRQDAADAGGQDDGPPMAVYPGAQAPVTPPVTPPVGGPPVGGPPVGGPPNLGGRPNPASPFAQPAINALAKNCMNCHTGPGSKGEVVIFSQLNQLNPDAPFKTMLREVQQGRMPPRQSNFALTQQEYQAVVAWLEGR